MKKIVILLLIILAATALRFCSLGIIDKIYFDEVLFVHEALKYKEGVLFLDRESPAVPKHPLLPIAFMRQGISIFGFNYLGWRFFSALFGVLSVAGLFMLAKELSNWRTALLASFLFSINFLHLVFSRIAMSESYLIAFLIFGYYFLLRDLKTSDQKYLVLSGLFFGLALASKWAALFSVLGAGLIYFILSKEDKRSVNCLGYLFGLPVAVFFIVSMFLNLSAGMDVVSWLGFEARNLKYHMIYSYVHPYWAWAWGWPFLLRATPFFLVKTLKGAMQAVLAFGNPAVYWVMLPALAYLVYEYIKKRSAMLLFILIGFFGAYLPWVIYDAARMTPLLKGRVLFFYYFLPALPFYLMGLAHILDKLLDNRRGRIVAISYLILLFALFLLFSPLLYGTPISPAWFNKLIWIKGWI